MLVPWATIIDKFHRSLVNLLMFMSQFFLIWSYRCTQAVSTLRAEAIEVKESNRITEAVNVTQSGQIQEREARVSSLLGEVEVLRARKAVVLRFLGEREGGEREVWRRERERMEVEIR